MAIQISSSYYSGYANRRASANSAWFRQYRANMVNQSSDVTNGAFDYNAAMKQSTEMVNQYKDQMQKTTQLRKDSAEFLKTYSKDIKQMESSALAVSGANLDALIGAPSADGKISDENMKKTTEAVQSMVDAYNSTLSTLNKNADRGTGTTQQLARMAGDPASTQAMDMVGVSVEKDGSLKLDTEKLTAAIRDAAASDAKTGTSNQMNLIKDAIGGRGGVAEGVQFDARMGQSTSAASLISNDLMKLDQMAMNNPLNSQSMYNRGGSYNMMNMGAIGLLMNVMA